jgi:putative ATPase
MREEGYGAGYKYAHDFEDALPPGETYLPEELQGSILYEPTERGHEARIKERLAKIRASRPKKA